MLSPEDKERTLVLIPDFVTPVQMNVSPQLIPALAILVDFHSPVSLGFSTNSAKDSPGAATDSLIR